MLPQLVVFEPQGRTLEYARHAGEEFATVLAGGIQIDFSDTREPIDLGEGDSAYFDARLPHIYRNTTHDEARLIAVCTPPIASGHARGSLPLPKGETEGGAPGPTPGRRG
jgi:mannose-6-phosphate isomerase-like protein (cupin superfamily)